MSDDLVKLLERLALTAETANHGTDEHRLMPAAGVADIVYEAKDRIEELEAQIKKDALQYLSDAGQMGETIDDLTRRHEHALRKIDVLEDQLAKAIEELEERLKAATDDAKEAEAYAGEMEAVLESIKAKLASCEKYREAYAECDRIGTQAVRDLEAKLAKAVEALIFYAEGEWPEDYPGGVLFAAGDDTPEFKTHIDYGDKARTTLAELTGGKDA